MPKVTGWGIPLIGSVSLSLGLWALILAGGHKTIKFLSEIKDDPPAQIITSDSKRTR